MTTKPQHSPEPWRAKIAPSNEAWNGKPGLVLGVPAKDGGDYGPIAECGSRADARRIVACVNACEGMPADELHAGSYAELRNWGIAQQIDRDRLAAENAMLREALRDIPSYAGLLVPTSRSNDAAKRDRILEFARAALAGKEKT